MKDFRLNREADDTVREGIGSWQRFRGIVGKRFAAMQRPRVVGSSSDSPLQESLPDVVSMVGGDRKLVIDRPVMPRWQRQIKSAKALPILFGEHDPLVIPLFQMGQERCQDSRLERVETGIDAHGLACHLGRERTERPQFFSEPIIIGDDGTAVANAAKIFRRVKRKSP